MSHDFSSASPIEASSDRTAACRRESGAALPTWLRRGGLLLAVIIGLLVLMTGRAQANLQTDQTAKTVALTTQSMTSRQIDSSQIKASVLLSSASSGEEWDDRFGPPPAGLGANNQVIALLTHPDGSIYATGTFTQVGSVAANGIARWNPTTETWSALGSGLTIADGSSEPRGNYMDVDAAGNLYVVGSFVEAGGLTVNNVAMWNPNTQQWSSLGTGLNQHS